MVRNGKEKNVSGIVKSVARNYPGLDIEDFGVVPYDSVLGKKSPMLEQVTVGRPRGAREDAFVDSLGHRLFHSA